jgi:hypothetical protein
MTRADFGALKHWQNMLNAVHAIIKFAPSADSREILERQRMFRAIIDDPDSFKSPLSDRLFKVHDKLGGLVNYLEGFDFNEKTPLKYFNVYILLESFKDMKNFFKYSYIMLFLDIVDMNLRLSGITAEEAGIDGDIKLVRELLDLRREYNKVRDERAADEETKARLSEEIMIVIERIRQLTGRIPMYGTEDIISSALDGLMERLTGIPFESKADMDSEVTVATALSGLGKDGSPEKLGKLKVLSLLDESVWPEATKELAALRDKLHDATYKRDMMLLRSGYVSLTYSASALLEGRDVLSEFVAWLKSYDSVHLNQIANYFEWLLRPLVLDFKNGREFLKARPWEEKKPYGGDAFREKRGWRYF